MNRIRFQTFCLIALAGLGLAASPAFAHKLLIDCRVKGDNVHVEAFYDDDTPAQRAKISVEDSEKRIVAQGRTNERGVWTCSLPAPGNYTVRAESVGHAASESLTIADARSPTKSAADPRPSIRHRIGAKK